MAITEYGKKARSQYNREWERKHRESKKARNERYWNKKGEELRLKELGLKAEEELKRGAENV